MSYCEKRGGLAGMGTQGPAVLTGAGVLAHRYMAQMALKVVRVGISISTATVSTGNIVITVKKRPTVGSASGESTIGTLTIPTSIAAGKKYYKDLSGVHVDPGEEIAFDVTTAAAGGGAAGAGVPFCEVEEDPEYVGNQSDMVASA